MGTFILILCLLIQFVYGQDYDTIWRPLYCSFTDTNLIGSNFSDLFRVEYVSVGDNLKIPCCQKYYINTTKQFYHRNRFFTDEEKPLMRNYDELAWYIGNIQETQTGAYYCKDDFSTTNAFTFIYFIDIDNPDVTTIRGKMGAYLNYTHTYLNPLNKYLSTTNNPALIALKEKTGLGLVAGMRWDPWNVCDFCAGEKTRKGRCHFQPVIIDETRWIQCEGMCEFYIHSLHVDCRAHWTLEKLFPELAEMTKDIPNFLAVAKCVGPCVSDVIPGYDYTKKLRTRILNVGDSAVLSCPGFTRKKNCHWKHDGAKLTSNEYDPFRPISVNELCMLYLNYVTKAEKGNFTCYLNDKMIQQNKVIVEVLYSEVDKAWWRHVVYLLYVIFLCFIIIVGGIAIGCLQKNNFRKVNAQEVIEMYSTRRMEYERLLPTE